jgi:capsular exopolysaccharide synthesis family protein
VNYLFKDNDSINIEIVDIRTIFKTMRKRMWVVISGVLGMIIIASVLSFFILEPVYEARVLLRVTHPVQLINSQNIEAQGLEGTVNSLSNLPKMTMQTHVSQIQSEAMMDRVAKKLNLREESFQGRPLSHRFGASVIKDTNLVLLTARHNNPALTRDLVNTLSQEYIQFISEMNQEQMEQTIMFLEQQYQQIENKLNEVIEKWNAFQTRDESNLTFQEQAEKIHREMQITHLRQTMELLAEGTAETRIKGGIDFGQASILIVSAAGTPVKPVKPDKILNIAIAFILGLIIFIPLAFILEHLDYKIKTPDDVEKYLKLPVLGLIPNFDSKLQKNCLSKQPVDTKINKRILTTFSPKSLPAEAYRLLQTNLSFSALRGSCRSILFTSAVQSVGKSTIVSNLAVVLAQAGHRVLVVDCDLRKPSQHHIFGLDNSRGLLNVLFKQVGISECIYQTREGPWVLPSGPIPPNPLEVISSKQLRNFWIEQIKVYDFVLVDAPPVLPVADTVILATQLDGVILVFDAAATPVDIALEVKTRLEKVNARIIGAVLNRVKVKKTEYYYYYQGIEGG